MFAVITLYGFALPSDIETMKKRLLNQFDISTHQFSKNAEVALVEDDSQMLCTLYRVPVRIRYNDEAIAKLLREVSDMITDTTMVKKAIVKDSKKDAVHADLPPVALVS